MLEDAAGIRRVVLACGTVDLRKGIDGLATIIGDRYGQNPFEKGTLFLFCGKRSDRCKGLLWMGTGFLLLYKRFEDGRLSWPRNIQEAAELTGMDYENEILPQRIREHQSMDEGGLLNEQGQQISVQNSNSAKSDSGSGDD